MDNDKDDIPGDKKKGRGRPKKDQAQAIPILLPAPQQATSSKSPSKSSSKSPSRQSPSRKGAKFLDMSRPIPTIDMTVLETCIPSVKQKSITEAKQLYEIPPKVLELYERLKNVPYGGIPSHLKVSPALLSSLSQTTY